MMTPTNSLLGHLWQKYTAHVAELAKAQDVARTADRMPAEHYRNWCAAYLASNPVIEAQYSADGYLARLQSGELLLLSAVNAPKRNPGTPAIQVM